jgi:hypothetical protein
MPYPSPGPLARATLSRWERDLPECFFQFGYHSLFQEGSFARTQEFSRISQTKTLPDR